MNVDLSKYNYISASFSGGVVDACGDKIYALVSGVQECELPPREWYAFVRHCDRFKKCSRVFDMTPILCTSFSVLSLDCEHNMSKTRHRTTSKLPVLIALHFIHICAAATGHDKRGQGRDRY